MTSQELREKYLKYFQSKGHKVIPSASLIPDNDPTVLFTTAGMHPLIPFLLGEKHPEGQRLCDVQKCIRTGDIDEVGDPFHHTFFEMLGNWSLGDYFKKEAIEMSFEFLTKELNISLEKLAVTVFGGDDRFGLEKDEESVMTWKSLGISKERIAYMPGGVLEREDNWWGPAGDTGPCGPSTEIFFWVGKENPPKKFDPKNKQWVEIGNDVLMSFQKTSEGKFISLKQKNIDFGGGLERMLSSINGFDDNYQTDIFNPIIKKIEELAGKKYNQSPEIKRAMRIVADHSRSAVFILGDEKGVTPSNVDQGYVLRKLIRRSVIKAKFLGINEIFSHLIAREIISAYKNIYPELQKNKDFIIEQLVKEEEKFRSTVEKGSKMMDKYIEKSKSKIISGNDAFVLHTTYGLPIDLIKEIANDKGYEVDEKSFADEFKKHQELSRTASAGKFKGGLADASEETTKGHTATHLLLAALRKVLGDHVFQKGSNITPERIRLDFSHKEKLSGDQIKKIEELVNEVIKNNVSVTVEEMSVDEAKKAGALGVFEHKYQERVKVYTIGNFSKEICGGPHVKSTGELKSFKILQETASSAGVRRIKAVLDK